MAAGVVAFVAAGCGGGGGSEDSGSASVGEAAPAPAQGGPGVAEKPGADANAGAPVKFRLEDRAIIYTGSITVRVQDVGAAATRATSIATGSGGFVGGDKRSSDGSHAEATMVLRVPASKFGAVVDQLAELGDQEQRDITTEDVTEEALDLDARISSQRARVDSGRRLLAQAKTLSDLVMLEGELAKREADLASLEAKKRRMDDLTALSTITVTLLVPRPEAAPAEEDDEIGFMTGLEAGWTGLVGALVLLLTIVGLLLPWLIVIVPVVLGTVWLARRHHRQRLSAVAAPPAPAPTPPSP